MRSKPDIDPDGPARSQRRLWPIRSIRQLMVVVAASGMLLAGAVTMARQPLSSTIGRVLGFPTPTTMPPRLAMVPVPRTAVQPDVFPPQPRDHSVIIIPESIDRGMVVRAPEWIDPKMVFTPSGGGWQPEQGGLPAPRAKGPAPEAGPQYKLVPVPDGSIPPAKAP
ncbi:MAG: hypothetical protein ACLQIB_28620 [Isosphaeraceae bacterium]